MIAVQHRAWFTLHSRPRDLLPSYGGERRGLLQGACYVVLWLVLVVLGAYETWAQGVTCPPYKQEELQPPSEIHAQNGVLSTTLTIVEQDQCVPVWDTTDPQNPKWNIDLKKLRTYNWPDAPTDTQPPRRIPGPTLRVRRDSSQGAKDGDRIKINLINQLQPAPDDQCDKCDPTLCSGSNPPVCCQAKDTFPECFHGINTTNLHFHGTHVSPQAPQDYVLLELQPSGTPAGPGGHHVKPRATRDIGQYQYAVDRLPWNQAEGTHWYHPHKHGSVAFQMLNGMAGALLIEGPFDDWLNNFFKPTGGLQEKLLVIQQIEEAPNFFKVAPVVPMPLVNGQANPIITMRPNEIQRWRFVMAGTTAATQLTINFPPGTTAPTLWQIAQDGIQFAPENYQNQPLGQGLQTFNLAPGNRQDFLVQAPQAPGMHPLIFRVFAQLADPIRPQAQARHQLLARSALGAAAANPPLLMVNVAGPAKTMTRPTQEQWPPMPAFLADIVDNIKKLDKPIVFNNTGNPGSGPAFYINVNGINKQFDPTCADLTMQRGTAEEWRVENSSANLRHPFHIHTNPFQLVQLNGQDQPRPWVWWDTFALPLPQNGQNGSITIRHRFEDFTGEYVVHCHFLGHEDRGMMIAVQTVCPPVPGQPPGLFFGKPQEGGLDSCALPNLKPAAPKCPGM